MTFQRISKILVRAGLSIFLSLSLMQCTYAQQDAVDSIMNLLKKHEADDTRKVQLISDLAYSYHLIHPDSTTTLAKEAYDLAWKLNDEKGQADALKHWAIGAYLKSEQELAINKNKEALQLYEKIGEKKGKGAVLNNMAIINHDQGRFPTALYYYQESLKIRKEINDEKGIAGCYNNIGNVYSDMGNYSESLLNLFEGLKIREKLNERSGIANSLGNIARVYSLLNKYDEALEKGIKSYKISEEEGILDGVILSSTIIGNVYHAKKDHENALRYFFKGLELSKQMGNMYGQALCLVNIGDEYIAQKKFAEAEKVYREALALTTTNRDMEGIAVSYIGLGVVMINTDRVKEGIGHLEKSLELATEMGSKLRILETSKHLAEAYERINDHKSANIALKRYAAYKDSLFNEEAEKKAEEVEYNFLLEKKQAEIALLEKDRSIQEGENIRQRISLVALAIGLGLLGLVIVVLLRSRAKEKRSKELILDQKREIEKQATSLVELNELKDKTFSVLSHDLRSPVASLIGVVNMMDNKLLSQEDFMAMRGNFNQQLKSLSHLLDNLLYWSKSHMKGGYELRKETVELEKVVRQNFDLFREMAAQKGITLSSDINDSLTITADPDHIDIVLRNLISNAIKFTHAKGEVNVSAASDGKQVTMMIRDSGIGMSKEVLAGLFSNKPNIGNYGTKGEKGTGIGLLLTREFIEKNGGTIRVESELGKGSVFYLTFPV